MRDPLHTLQNAVRFLVRTLPNQYDNGGTITAVQVLHEAMAKVAYGN